MKSVKLQVLFASALAISILVNGCATSPETNRDLWFLSAGNGDAKSLIGLIEQGWDVETVDEQQNTALMLAAQNGHAEAVSLLIDAGADPDITDGGGMTALMRAVIRGQIETVRLLVAARADVNIESKQGQTALMMARENGNAGLVQLLHQRMLEVASTTGESTFLPFTIEKENIDSITYLFWAADITSKPHEMRMDEEMVIPNGITYIPRSRSENEGFVREFFDSMTGAADMIEMHGEGSVIFGPHLTTLLKRANLLHALQHKLIVLDVPAEKPFVAVACGVVGESVPKALNLVRNLIFSGHSVQVRKLSPGELDWYWAIIAWDIEEPILMFENEQHSVMIDFSQGETVFGTIFFVDLFDTFQSPRY
jgi:hypothetical protein